MQSSNSVWKVAALAGVVGLGLLIVLQAQQGLSRKPVAGKDAKLRLEEFKPRTNAERSADKDKTAEAESLASNSEPLRLTKNAKNARKLPSAEQELDLSVEDLPPSRTATSRESSSARSRVQSFAGSLAENDTSSDDLELPAKPKTRSRPRAELSIDEPIDVRDNSAEMTASDDTRNKAEELSFDETLEVGSTRSPRSTAVRSSANSKAKAQQLVQLARKLVDNGLMEEAQLKASEAADLQVAFGPLEDTPEAVLEEIERLTTATERPSVPARQPILLTAGTKETSDSDLSLNDPFEEVPVRKPAKKSLLNDDDNLFADNPPELVNGKKRQADPPAPPAEAEELPIELPPLPEDADMPPRNTAKARPKTADDDSNAPNRLKPLTAAPIDGDEKVVGEGTVHADSPRGPQRPELKIEKVAPPNATLGQAMVYTIVIRNIGESVAHAVVVEDQVPKGTTLSGTIPRAELTGKKLLWRLGTIKSGEQKEIQVKVIPVTEGQIGSVATVNFQAEVASRTTVASPKLSMKMNAPQQIRLGETATLSFQITNHGSADAQRVVLRNLIPENLRVQDLSERDLEYDMGTIAAGKSQTVNLPLTTTRPGKAINRAVLTTDGATAAEAQAEINVIGQLIGLHRTGPTNSFVGRPADFENRLTNNSLNSTANTLVVETLPSNVEFVSANEGGKFDARQRTVTWHVPHLDPQQTLTLKLKVTPKAIGSHAGSVQITEANRKGAVSEYQFRAIGAAVLGVEFSEKAEAFSKGEQFHVRMQIRNKGSGAASNVAIRIVVPAELQFVSARGPVSQTSVGKEIIFEPIPEIGGQGNVSFDLNFKAIAAGDSKLEVELQSDQFKKPITHQEPLVIFANGSN